jgi:hypothetical protein
MLMWLWAKCCRLVQIATGVLQIHLNGSSNTSLNYKFMARLTSQTRQHERFHLSEYSNVKIKQEQK